MPERLVWAWGRFGCRALRRHNGTCRGRVDHAKSLRTARRGVFR